MIGLDTNLVLRCFIDDDSDQCARARQFVATRCTPDDPGFINWVVLCELVWVLNSAYRYGRNEVAHIIEELLVSTDIRVEGPEIVRSALDEFGRGNASFADIIIRGTNRMHGCEATATFDREAAKLDGFVAVP